MIKVKIKYFLKFKEITGKDEEEVRLTDNTTLNDLINFLKSKYGEAFSREFTNPSGDYIAGSVLIIVNSMVATNLGVKLKEGDEVELTYTVFGG